LRRQIKPTSTTDVPTTIAAACAQWRDQRERFIALLDADQPTFYDDLRRIEEAALQMRPVVALDVQRLVVMTAEKVEPDDTTSAARLAQLVRSARGIAA